tara:strand:- start:402 stop:503 length:102 start_codon:yes stop_codon:yes gene_type:complete
LLIIEVLENILGQSLETIKIKKRIWLKGESKHD